MTWKVSKAVKVGAALALLCGGLVGSSGIVDAEASTPGVSEVPAHASGYGRQLAGSSWQLSAVIDDGELTAELPATSSLTFGEEGQLHVESGCNVGGGSVYIFDDFFFVDDLMMTLMACSPPIMKLERQVLSTLQDIVPYYANGNSLVLVDEERVLLYQAAE